MWDCCSRRDCHLPHRRRTHHRRFGRHQLLARRPRQRHSPDHRRGLLAFVDGLAVVGIAVLLYPLLKDHSEPLAHGYVGLRVAEYAAILIYLATPLLVLTLGDGLANGIVDESASQHLGLSFQAQHDAAIVMVYRSTSVAGSILAFLLHRTRLIPRSMQYSRRRLSRVVDRNRARYVQRDRRDAGRGLACCCTRWAFRAYPPHMAPRQRVHLTRPRRSTHQRANPVGSTELAGADHPPLRRSATARQPAVPRWNQGCGPFHHVGLIDGTRCGCEFVVVECAKCLGLACTDQGWQYTQSKHRVTEHLLREPTEHRRERRVRRSPMQGSRHWS